MISSTTSSQAATRALGNRDILMDIVRHLDRASLYPFLLTSKACAIATLPRLYYTYTLSPNIPSTFVDYDPAPNTSRPDRWMRRIAWSYIRTLQIPTHSESTCTLIHQDSLPSLPNLQTIEMKGGGRTQKMGKECKLHECKILAQFTAQQMVIRKLHLLPSLHVNHMVVILRPCQFPFDPRGDPVVVAGTFGGLVGVETVDIVLWDEDHRFKIDWNEHYPVSWCPSTSVFLGEYQDPIRDTIASGPGMGGISTSGYGNQPLGRYFPSVHNADVGYKTKDCNYCNQQECVRYTPNTPKQLAGVVYTLTRYTSVKEVSIWNAEKSLGVYQWWDSKMTLGECHSLIREQGWKGREERLADGKNVRMSEVDEVDEVSLDTPNLDDTSVAIVFKTGKQWAEKRERDKWSGIDPEEDEYWDTILHGQDDQSLDDHKVEKRPSRSHSSDVDPQAYRKRQ